MTHPIRRFPASTSRSRLLAAALVATLPLTGCDPGDELDDATEDEDLFDGQLDSRLLEATEAPHFSMNAVVRVAGCTGTLIGPHHVLTSSHCVPRVPIIGGATPGDWYSLPFPLPVAFGPDRAAPIHTAYTEEYSEAGRDDVLLLRLETDVPAHVATPAIPLTDVPGGGAALPWLQGEDFSMVGFGEIEGGAPAPIRRRATATVDEFPSTWAGVLQPNLLQAEGDDCAAVQDGDDGGPLLWFDYSTGIRHVVGVARGEATCGGSYVATFGEGGADGGGTVRPNVGDWLEEAIPIDLVVSGPISLGCTGTGGSPTVLVRVKNQGLTRGRGWVDLFLDEEQAPPIGTLSSIYEMSPYLDPGQEALISFPIDPMWQGQAIWIDVLLDTTQDVTEENEDNNRAMQNSTILDCSFG